MKIVQLSDTHLLADEAASLWSHNTTHTLGAVIDALPDQIDVLVVTGDVTEDGAPGAYRRALAMTDIGADQRYFLAGNHDNPDAFRTVIGPAPALRMQPLSNRWTMALVDSQWQGHDAGRVDDATLASLRTELTLVQSHVAMCLHHPPVSVCANDDCGLSNADALLDVIRGSPVRVVLSGHVHQQIRRHGRRHQIPRRSVDLSPASSRWRPALPGRARAAGCTGGHTSRPGHRQLRSRSLGPARSALTSSPAHPCIT